MFGHKEKLLEELQAQGGEVAWASVLEAKAGWSSQSGGGTATEHMHLTLRVTPETGDPFEVDFKQTFSHLIPMKGWSCQVIYDPADHERIAVVGNTITPQNIDRARAVRDGDTSS